MGKQARDVVNAVCLDAPDVETVVRPEYAALADEFVALAAEFGHDISPALRSDIARLAAAIEAIDRRIDEATADVDRRSRWRHVVQALHDVEEVTRPAAPVERAAPRELVSAVEDLRALAIERGVLTRIRRIVQTEARTSEAIRAASTTRDFVRVVEREGRLTAALALVVAGSACGRAFRRFFFRLAAPANLVDKILDARGDYARGEIGLAPGPGLYAGLVIALVGRGARLLFTSWRPRLIARLALRYLVS